MCVNSNGSRTSGARGLSHVEVLVAMLIIGLATPMLMSGIMGSLTRARRSYDQGAATAWVQGEVDFLRRQCYEGLRPGSRRVTASELAPGEPPLPEGFAAARVLIEPAGPRYLRATVGLYKDDWPGEAPPGSPVLATTTLIGDLRVAGMCP
jgi:hypothetical protein